jgi:hypothetical protein
LPERNNLGNKIEYTYIKSFFRRYRTFVGPNSKPSCEQIDVVSLVIDEVAQHKSTIIERTMNGLT